MDTRPQLYPEDAVQEQDQDQESEQVRETFDYFRHEYWKLSQVFQSLARKEHELQQWERDLQRRTNFQNRGRARFRGLLRPRLGRPLEAEEPRPVPVASDSETEKV
jgi:hypothetical protein